MALIALPDFCGSSNNSFNIVGTTNNPAAISMSIERAAKRLIKKGCEITDASLNMIEIPFRKYDSCFGCATHTLPGQMPIKLCVCDVDGNMIYHKQRY